MKGKKHHLPVISMVLYTKDIEDANNEQTYTGNIFNLGSQANARVLYCVYVRNLERRQQNVR